MLQEAHIDWKLEMTSSDAQTNAGKHITSIIVIVRVTSDTHNYIYIIGILNS